MCCNFQVVSVYNAISSVNLAVSELWSQGDFCRVASFPDCLNINIAVISMLSEFTVSSRERQASQTVFLCSSMTGVS